MTICVYVYMCVRMCEHACMCEYESALCVYRHMRCMCMCMGMCMYIAHYVHCKNKAVVLTTWWLLQLHHVGHVGDNTITYNVKEIAYAYIN